MELEHSFTVPVPEERAWEVLLDVERVAPCMPGASLDSVDGDAIAGRIKVKVGPIAMTYAGTARFTERDPHAHVVTLEASGKETRGAGTASAKVRSMLEGQGDHTHVIVHTTLNVTGRPAQFGRGVMAEVGGKLIGIFAANLADMLTAGEPAVAVAAGEPAAAAGDSGAPAGGSAEPGQQEAGGQRVLASADGGADRLAGALAQPVEELQLSLRSYNSLRREGIHTVGDLASRTREDLLAIDNIGPASVEEIRQKLAALEVSLSESAGSANGLPRGSQETTGLLPPSGQPLLSTAPPVRPRIEARPPDEDAIDLLSVAGVPVLKRALPAAGALLLAVLVVLGVRRRKARGRR
jgi:carbon monoxide dehydrogenase subunit G